MKSSCHSRSQAQVVRSKQPAYLLALPAVCMRARRINQPLSRWSVNYRGAFQNRPGTQRNWATLPLTQISDYSFMQHGMKDSPKILTHPKILTRGVPRLGKRWQGPEFPLLSLPILT